MTNFKKYAFWTLEIIIWLGLLLIPASFISYILNPDLDIKQECTIEFPDINGVIVGSPVNFEGYNIGFIKKIDLLPSSVQLTLAITQEDYLFPQCAKVKIEESGLGGSRSLEIYPCQDDELGCGLHPQKLKRINELIDDATEFMNVLLEGMNNMWYILDSNINSESYINSSKNQEKIKCIYCDLDELTRRLEKANESADRNLPVYINSLHGYIKLIERIKIEPEKIKHNQLQTEERINKINENLSLYNPLITKKQVFRMYCMTEFVKRPSKLSFSKDMAIFNYYLENMRNSLNAIEKFISPDVIEKRSNTASRIRKNTEGIGDF